MIAEEGPDEISGGQRDAECADANREARPATAKELAQPASRKVRAVTEESVNGFPELGRFVRQSGRPVQVYREPQSRRRRSLFRLIDNEFLGIGIEVSFAERRRIDGVEELLQLGNADFDEFTVRREQIAS